MEQELEEIRTKMERFMRKYNCSIKVETICLGYTCDGEIVNPKARIIINS